MAEVWTHGTWVVRAEQEDAFVDAWEALGDWATRAFPGANGTLLRDPDRAGPSSASGPGRTPRPLLRGEPPRASPSFAAIERMPERVEPRLLELVTTKG